MFTNAHASYTIYIQPFGASASFAVDLEETENSVRHLKRAIQEQQGTSTFVQQLFLLGKSSEDTREEPLGEEENITGSCTIALCVLTISGKILSI